MSESKQIALTEVLREVRKSIRQAHVEALEEASHDATKTPVMRFKECTVEFGLDIEVVASGGIKLWVLKVGGERTQTETNTIKITYEAHGNYPLLAQVLLDDLHLASAERQPRRKKEDTP